MDANVFWTIFDITWRNELLCSTCTDIAIYFCYFIHLIYPRYGYSFWYQELATGRIRENGMASVGCSQFFESYAACGRESIIWNVYAKRVR